MKTSMHSPARLILIMTAMALFRPAHAAETEAGSVMSPTQREEMVDNARKLLAHREVKVVANDPFNPEGFSELVAGLGRPTGTASTPSTDPQAGRPAGPRNDRDLAQAIGAVLKPTGFFTIGGQPTLLFGQKRVKAGGSVTITFEGSQYTLEITTIAPPNFTLRLNREEFTRTIK